MNGSYAKWEERHKEKIRKVLHDQGQYLYQTMQLVRLIESETRKGNPVELYCTWTGDYGAEPESHATIDTSKVDIHIDFEIAEKELTTFI